MQYYVLVDIGGTEVKYAIGDECGKLYNKQSASVNFDHYQTPILDTVVKHLTPFINECLYPLSGIAVSATGQIDTNTGIVIGSAGHIDNWLNSNIKETLETKFNLPTTVCNDANCMILAEQWLGGAKGYSNVVGITIGTGIGGGIIVNNKLLLGSKGIAGEVGHISIDHNGNHCTCGSLGCYEHLASTRVLVENIVKLDPTITCQQANGRYIFDQLDQGNELYQKVVNAWIYDIAIGLVSLIHIFNPDCVLIGGGVSNQKEKLIDPLESKIKQLAMPRFTEDLVIKQATLKNDAGMIGALKFYLDSNNL